MNMKLSVADGHLCNMGRMIEEMEGKLRNSLDQVLDFLIIGFTLQLPICCIQDQFLYFFLFTCSLVGGRLG